MYRITNSTDFNKIGWNNLMDNQRALPGVYVFHVVIEYKDRDIKSLIGNVINGKVYNSISSHTYS